ncbi:sensor histidine kinase (plasmid) [Streptomyces sp. BI20]|uniref:sensor histidine kinase n=1 Tax=Streptomyces sp. BI20 TaxID=3403460 RepID=UPI003C73CBF6
MQVRTGTRGGWVVQTVENPGPRPGPERVATLTEPFRRATGRVHAEHAGAGLGLAVVDSVTRAHDGVLTLAPREGGGPRVTVDLPAAPGPAAG